MTPSRSRNTQARLMGAIIARRFGWNNECVQKKVDAGLSRDLKTAPGARRLAIAAEYLTKVGGAFQQDTIDRLHAEILRAFPVEDRPALLAWGSALPSTAAAEYLRARLAADAGDNAASAEHWERF